MKYLLLVFCLFAIPIYAAAQNKPAKIVFTDDIDRFWVAYDKAGKFYPKNIHR
jgi:hypothetical protein